MSIMTCSLCCDYIDTDEDVEGLWPAVDNNSDLCPDYVCFGCVQEQPDVLIKAWGYDPDNGYERY